MSNTDCMLTTFDNTFNPFTDFIRWWKEDLRLGHNCCSLIAKRADTSKIFSDQKNEEIIEEAIDSIVSDFPYIYRKVYESDYKKRGA